MNLYARHIPLLGKEGIKKLKNSSVLIAGIGGLGTVVADILVRTGIGELHIVDYGEVDLPDLNRQILYYKDDLGKKKVYAAKQKLKWIREDVVIKTYTDYIDENFKLPERVRVIVDCLDSFKAKFAVDKIAVKYNIPLVHAGLNGFFGQITTIVPGETARLCEILHGVEKENKKIIPVLGSVSTLLGAIQALEVVKLLCGKGNTLKGKLLIVDLLDMSFETVELR